MAFGTIGGKMTIFLVHVVFLNLTTTLNNNIQPDLQQALNWVTHKGSGTKAKAK